MLSLVSARTNAITGPVIAVAGGAGRGMFYEEERLWLS